MWRPARLGGQLALGLWLTFPGAVHAGTGVWTSGGPYGGIVGAMAIDPANPAVIFVGMVGSQQCGSGVSCGGAVFKSTDSGGSWARSSAGIWPPDVRALAFQPGSSATLYAGTSGGVFRSTDSGGSWAAARTGLTSPGVQALAVDPQSPATLYAGTDWGGVFRSTDSGNTWVAAITGLRDLDVRSLAVHPSSPSTLYAGTRVGKIFKSTNSGGLWTLAYSSDGVVVEGLAIDPVNPATLYAVTGSSARGVLKSTDSGASWAASNSGLTNGDLGSVAIDPSNTARLYVGAAGGVFASTDFGSTWAPTGVTNGGVGVVAIDPVTTSTIYAGTPRVGVLRSTNFGDLWSPANSGLTSQWVRALAVDPATLTTVYAGTQDAGVFKSTNSGTTWVNASTGLDCQGGQFPILALAIDLTSPATLYAASSSWCAGLYKSTDAGASWAPSAAGLPSTTQFAVSLAVDPSLPSTLYAGIAGTGNGLFKSTDAGATWGASALNAAVLALAIDPEHPATLYAGADGGTGGWTGVTKSTDAGATWAATGLTNGHVHGLAIDPTNPAILYARTEATGGGFMRSTDSGATWTPSTSKLPPPVPFQAAPLAIDPTSPTRLYTGALDPGVLRSTDSGGFWAAANLGLPERAVSALAFAPTGTPTLYAGLDYGSVWQASPPPPAFAKGDLDADGTPDIVFRGAVDGTRNKVWFMNGVARTSETTITPDAPSTAWRIRGVDDFNSDGRNDLVFWNEANGQVAFWLMNGAARVGPAVPLGGAPVLSTNWELAATADFDHDTRPDIVWRNVTSQKIVIWTLVGTAKGGAFTPTPSQAVDGNWALAGARDYNHDGNTDFLWYNATSGKLVTWYMDASVVRTSGQFTTPPNAGDNNWKVVASADYSGASGPGTPPSGSPDIVWRNETSGNQVVWHMDFASTRVHGEFTNPPANSPALDWTIVGPR